MGFYSYKADETNTKALLKTKVKGLLTRETWAELSHIVYKAFAACYLITFSVFACTAAAFPRFTQQVKNIYILHF